MSVAIAPTNHTVSSDRSARFVGSMTVEQYLALERNDSTNQRYEFMDGKVYRVAGASPEHNRIGRNVLFEIEGFCRRGNVRCETLPSDQKIFVHSAKYVYPDVCLVCGEAQFDFADALRNPCAVIEVLSPSTEREDRTDKFREYQRIESLRHYILIEQDRVSVTHYEKLAIGLWAIVGDYTNLQDNLKIAVDGAEITVLLSQVYYGVELPPDPTPSAT